MREILGDADPHPESPVDALRNDDFARGPAFGSDVDDDFDVRPSLLIRLWTASATASALAIASFVFAVASLLQPFVGYVITNSLFLATSARSVISSQRATAIAEIVCAGLALITVGAAFAATAVHEDQAERRTPQVMAGAAALIAIVSIVVGIVALVIVAGIHDPSQLS